MRAGTCIRTILRSCHKSSSKLKPCFHLKAARSLAEWLVTAHAPCRNKDHFINDISVGLIRPTIHTESD